MANIQKAIPSEEIIPMKDEKIVGEFQFAIFDPSSYQSWNELLGPLANSGELGDGLRLLVKQFEQHGEQYSTIAIIYSHITVEREGREAQIIVEALEQFDDYLKVLNVDYLALYESPGYELPRAKRTPEGIKQLSGKFVHFYEKVGLQFLDQDGTNVLLGSSVPLQLKTNMDTLQEESPWFRLWLVK
ncbi:hypothetical protein [Shouchella shacheensis]|uniref:hypothetical protein n=1 Tax=Shouchella shacheensis TaxID=1649580 RepID=UPI0012FAC627|nr:hypothetical protein [Shouchella shacheensis]